MGMGLLRKVHASRARRVRAAHDPLGRRRIKRHAANYARNIFIHADNGSHSYLTLTRARANPQMRPPIAKVLPRESSAA